MSPAQVSYAVRPLAAKGCLQSPKLWRHHSELGFAISFRLCYYSGKWSWAGGFAGVAASGLSASRSQGKRSNNALHRTPVVGFSRFPSAFAPARVSYGVGPHGGALVGYNGLMSITEIKTIIAQLPPPDLADLTEWFEEFQADQWDRQIANDVKAGRFDTILRRVDEQAESGQCRTL